MEQSQLQQQTIALGKKLVAEFTVNDRISLSLRWMAHFLAELICKVERETDNQKKDELNEKACRIILEIWQSRNSLPDNIKPGGLLEKASEVFASLSAKDPDIPYWKIMREAEDMSPWGKYARRIRENSEHSFSLLVYCNIGLSLLKREKEWSEFPDLLSAEEQNFISNLDNLLRHTETRVQIIFNTPEKKVIKKEPPSKLEKAFDKMQELLDAQQKALNELRNAVISKNKKAIGSKRGQP